MEQDNPKNDQVLFDLSLYVWFYLIFPTIFMYISKDISTLKPCYLLLSPSDYRFSECISKTRILLLNLTYSNEYVIHAIHNLIF